jgi:MFS transporter, DHA2 family, multidrug resistance protein
MASVKPLKGTALLILTISVSLGELLLSLDFSVANVALPYIAGNLGVSTNDTTWILTLFAAGNAVSLLLTGFLADRFGNVRVFVVCTLLFTLTSWLCGIAINFEMLLIARFFQGFLSGPLVPLSQSLLLMYNPPRLHKVAMTVWSLVGVCGPVFGPLIGGYFSFNYSWRWIFYVNIPIGLISAIATWYIVSSKDTKPIKRKIDLTGFILVTFAVVALQILVDNGENNDWFQSNFIVTLAIISFISFTLLIIWLLNSKEPIIDLALFKNRNFTVGTAVTAISYCIIVGNLLVFPLWLELYMGYDSLTAGLAISVMGIGPILVAPLALFLMNKFPLRYITAFCMVCFFYAFYYFSFFSTEVDFNYATLSRFFIGIPIGYYLAPLTVMTMAYIPSEKLSMASGIFQFFRIFFAGLGTSLLVSVFERRTTFHHVLNSESLTPYRIATEGALADLSNSDYTREIGLELLNFATEQQSATLGLNDVSLLSAYVYIPLIFLCLLFKSRPAHLKNPSQSDMMTAAH